MTAIPEAHPVSWHELVPEAELRHAVCRHARLRLLVRNHYLRAAGARLNADSPWERAGALLAALNRYQASAGYRTARRLGEDTRGGLEAALYQVLSFGPVPQSQRGLYEVLKSRPMETSTDREDTGPHSDT